MYGAFYALYDFTKNLFLLLAPNLEEAWELVSRFSSFQMMVNFEGSKIPIVTIPSELLQLLPLDMKEFFFHHIAYIHEIWAKYGKVNEKVVCP